MLPIFSACTPQRIPQFPRFLAVTDHRFRYVLCEVWEKYVPGLTCLAETDAVQYCLLTVIDNSLRESVPLINQSVNL